MKSVCIRVISNVLRQVSARDPFRNKLERARGSTEERDNVLVIQVFPHYGFLVERLWASSATGNRKMMNIKDLFSRVRILLRIHPNPFDANLGTVEYPFIHIAGTSQCDRLMTNSQNLRRGCIRCW